MRSKKIVLALLRQSQIAANGHVLTVLRAIITRWTAHFHAYDRLLLIQEHLRIIVYQDAALSSNLKKIVQGDARAKARAAEMCELIKTAVFWTFLARYSV